MALNLPSNIAIKGVTYGTPRVGNPAWAALFDATVCLSTFPPQSNSTFITIDLRLPADK